MEKRRVDAEGELSARERKRAKNREARSMDSPVRSAGVGGPRKVDVVEFAEARAFELNAIHRTIQKTRLNNTAQVFQSLPRGLRRRAASHNVKRVPARVRNLAKNEMQKNQNPKSAPQKQTRKQKRSAASLRDRYLRRQLHKNWLETHIWHAKRMHMVEKWGYRLADHPNEKSLRAAYRASKHLSIMHDASYIECVELAGTLEAITRVMNALTDPSLPSLGSARYSKGNRQYYGHLYGHLTFPGQLICPMQALWRPPQEGTERTLWLWIHPSAIQDALSAISSAITEDKSEQAVQCTHLQHELLHFQFTGPRTHALLAAVLEPTNEEASTEWPAAVQANQAAYDTWQSLRNLRSSDSVPPGAVIGLNVQDPRLSFPQKVPSRLNNDGETTTVGGALEATLNQWPENVARSDIWDAPIRKKLVEHMATEHELNQRRAQRLIPGNKLELTSKDARIPILLVQRSSLENNTQPIRTAETLSGWDIIVPAGWGMAFWKSFVFAGARVGGLREVYGMNFESGLPSFPQDYLSTAAFDDFRETADVELRDKWKRTPPAKRVNYDKLGWTDPFQVPFARLLKTRNIEVMDEGEDTRLSKRCYLLHSRKLIDATLDQANADSKGAATWQELLLAQLNACAGIRGLDLPLLSSPGFLGDHLDSTFVHVRLRYAARGVPEVNSMIYLIDDDKNTYDKWAQVIRRSQPALKAKAATQDMSDVDKDEDDEDEADLPEFPLDSEHIGYLTSGQYSYTLGTGLGIGACLIKGIVTLRQRDHRHQRRLKSLVLVRSPRSRKCRPAFLEIVT